MPTENLNAYKAAYTTDFRFTPENERMLGIYRDRMLHYLAGSAPLSILSLGVGHRVVPAGLIEGLGTRLNRYLILDGSPEIIEQFTSQNTLPPSVEILETYFEDFKTDEQFDALEMGFVLEHVDDPAQIVRLFEPLLKPGGLLFASVPNALCLHRRVGQEAGLLADPYQLTPADLELGHKRYYDADTFRALFQAFPLSLQALEGLYLKPITTGQMQTLGFDEKIHQALSTVGVAYPELCNGMLAVYQKNPA